MAKKKKSTTPAAPVDQGSIFDHFAAHQPTHPYAEPPARDTSAGQPDLNEVLRRIGELETSNKELREQNARLSIPMATAPARDEPRQMGPQEVKLDLVTNMPDPVTDKPGYDRELQTRIGAYTQAQVAAARSDFQSQSSQQQNADMLWTRFSGAHPEWAEHEDLVGTVATKVIEAAKARGVDAQRYMFGTTDLFISDVAKELNAKYGKLVASEEGDDDEPTQKKAGADDDGRTAGVFGGLTSGGNPPSGGNKKPAGGLIEDLQAIQLKEGLY